MHYDKGMLVTMASLRVWVVQVDGGLQVESAPGPVIQ